VYTRIIFVDVNNNNLIIMNNIEHGCTVIANPIANTIPLIYY